MSKEMKKIRDKYWKNLSNEEEIKCKVCFSTVKITSLYSHIKSKYHNSYLTSEQSENRNIRDCFVV
jgi:hypothetical protein